EQEDAVLGDPLWRAGAVVLLLEEQPLPQGRAAAAVPLRPRHHRPAGLEEAALPLDMQREPLARVTRRQRPVRHVGLEPLAGVGPEGLLRSAPREVHALRLPAA